jgi:ABC-type multidrug transport system fused ATPase/permease subunit
VNNKNKKRDDNFDSEEQKILPERHFKKMIHRLFNFVFAGFLFFGNLTVSIESNLWLLKTKFLLAALTALLSFMSYTFGSDNSKRRTILRPNQMSQLHEKWDDREKRNNMERIFIAADRLFGSGPLKLKR